MRLKQSIFALVAMLLSFSASTTFAQESEEPVKGYKIIIYNEDGTKAMTIDGEKSASEFNLATALEDAYAFGDNAFLFGITGTPTYEVVFYQDLLVAETVEIPADKNVVLDLAGYKVTGGWNGSSTTNHIYALTNRGNLTIKDSSADAEGNAEGKIVSRGIYNYGKLTLESGTIDACDGNGGYAVNNESGSTFIMNGGVVSASYEDGDAPGNYDATALDVPEDCTATLNGGKITSVTNFTFAISLAGELIVPETSTVEVTGAHGAISMSAGSADIDGGTFICSGVQGQTDNVVYVTGGSMDISGGTFEHTGNLVNADSGAAVVMSGANGELTISGGEFTGLNGSVSGNANTTLTGGSYGSVLDYDGWDNIKQYVPEGETVTIEGESYTNVAPASGVAKVGENVFTTVLEALQYAVDNNAAELKILCDVREKMATDFYLNINADLTITADAPVKVEFYNDGTTYDFVVGSTNNNKLTIGENVHFDLVDRVIWLGYLGNNVTVFVNGYLGGYQIWHGANTVVNGTLDSHGEAFVMRRDATLTANEGAKVNANYFQIYSGHIVAENATITAGLVWVNNNHDYGIEGTVSFELDNTEFTSNGEVNIYAGEGKTVSVTLENSSLFDAKGVVTLGDNVKVVADATSSIQDANGPVVIPVAKVNGVEYADIQEAFKAATAGCTIDILADVTVDYYWDCRNTGSKFTVPVTINGNDHTLKFTNVVYDSGNHFAAFRFEDDATVNNLTVDMTEAQSGFQGRFRAISSKANLTVNGCTFIGNGSANNTRAIIFGEGAGSNAANLAISVANSNFEGWRRGISDNENVQDVKSVTVTGNTLKDAAVYVSANETVTFTGNTVEGAYVNIKSYTTGNTLNVTATGNTLEANTGDACNSIQAGGTVDAQGEFVVPAKGSNSFAYTKEENGYVRVWGEGGGNAKESYELKLYSGETLIATTKLNNVDNVINGDVYVTWNFYYPESTDDYWTTTWVAGHPNSAAQPTEVELYIDGTLVATTAAKMSGADDVAPVVWRNLGGVAIANLLGEGNSRESLSH